MSNNNQEALDLLFQSLKAGNMKPFQSYYNQYKQDFIHFGRKFSSDEELILDAYHDAFIALYENVISKKIVEMRSSLKTYVFSIGKYTIYNKVRESRKSQVSDTMENRSEYALAVESVFENSEESDKMRGYFNLLGDACKSLLIYFYYKRYSIEALVNTLGYKNENTVKAYKSRCLKKLKKIILESNENSRS
jgi:RNA polymerase sigma factor (sigma-70 family)